jgi:predicted transcriptional regulator
MNFSSENVLIETFLTKPKAFYRQATGRKLDRYYVLREFDSGYGIADIVIGAFAPYLSIRHLRSSIDANWAGTLVDAQRQPPFTVAEFAERYGVSFSTTREKLKQFVAAGFLKRDKQRRYTSAKQYRIAVGTSVAIEAKLKHWKQALNQARRYQRFAQYSYVLLDKQYSAPAEANIEIFKQHNIGLISMNGYSSTIHHSPVQAVVSKNSYFYKLNEAVYDYFKATYGCFGESDSI